MSERYDIAVIGAGIVGLATARELERRLPGATIAVLDKEASPGQHQTGHNSGVIHSGLYYRPGSLKARLCVEGRRRMLDFCREEDIPVHSHGKLVIATSNHQLPELDALLERGTANGLSGLSRLGPDGIKDIEPEAAGIAALHVPEAAVTDFSEVSLRIGRRLRGPLLLGTEVTGVSTTGSSVALATNAGQIEARAFVNCAGLHADRVAKLAGLPLDLRIIPFRGEYYRLNPKVEDMVRGLIYPVPDPRFPFLGVHFTRKLDGSVEVGPNAVLALAREHYRGSAPSPRDLLETVAFPGFWKIVARYWKTGTAELWHSLRASSYARLARSLVPNLGLKDLEKGGAGVRAQAVSRQGQLLDDFHIEETARAVHVLNAPSPAATSSFAIADYIADAVERVSRAQK